MSNIQFLEELAFIAFAIFKMSLGFVFGVFLLGTPLWPFLAYRFGRKYSKSCLKISAFLFFIPLLIIILLVSEPYFSYRDPSIPDGGGASLIITSALCMSLTFIAIGLFVGAQKTQ